MRVAALADHANYGIDRPDIIVGALVLGAASLGLGLFASSPIRTLLLTAGASLWGGSLFFALANPLKPRAARELLDSLNWRGDEVVLDVGCGRGLWLVNAAKHLTNGRAVGVDIWSRRLQSGNSPEKTLENARIEGVADRVEVSKAVAQRLPFKDETFHVVVSSLVVHHVPRDEQKNALKEMVRTLKPDGQLAMLEILGQAEAYVETLREFGVTDIRTAWSRPLVFLGFRTLRARKPAGAGESS